MILPSRSTLDKELTKLANMIQQLASMVDDALEKSLIALQKRDVATAQAIIAFDSEVNALRYEIEEECLRVLATQMPAARDLRFVVAATHIAGELERIGDHATSIADVVERLEEEDSLSTLHKLPKMVKRARDMVQTSIQAFIDQDVDAAYALAKRDSKMDKHYNRLLDEMMKEMHADEAYIERGTYLLWTGRHIERVGDRAINIAERVVFAVTAEFMEFD